MAMIDSRILERLDRKWSELERKRPLSVAVVARLRDHFAIEFTYNSNAIEGNRLTLRETELVISQGMTIKGRSLREHLEARDHHEATRFLYDVADAKKSGPVTEVLIRSLHRLVVRETKAETAGSYRKGSVRITGSAHIPPEGFDVPRLMREFVAWIRRSRTSLHPLVFASLAHHRLAAIHPFEDGNGRTARLLMNLLLMQRRYPLVVILKNDRKKYYRALEQADRGDEGPLVRLIAQGVERSLDLYLKAAGSTQERFISLAELAKGTPYSPKYLNLLIRSGKLAGHKEGRNWVSSKAALKQYLDARLRKRGARLK
jgi:Fic family protein